jgi:hypothetical protein
MSKRLGAGACHALGTRRRPRDVASAHTISSYFSLFRLPTSVGYLIPESQWNLALYCPVRD